MTVLRENFLKKFRKWDGMQKRPAARITLPCASCGLFHLRRVGLYVLSNVNSSKITFILMAVLGTYLTDWRMVRELLTWFWNAFGRQRWRLQLSLFDKTFE